MADVKREDNWNVICFFRMNTNFHLGSLVPSELILHELGSNSESNYSSNFGFRIFREADSDIVFVRSPSSLKIF